MKKKILAITLCIAMLAIAIVGGTLAYFTDTDAQKNTFTTGSVKIEQLERQFGENGLEEFEQNKTMIPAVGTNEVCADKYVDGHYTHFIDTNEIKNVVEKIVNVKNNSTIDIYAATLIATEDTNDVSTQYKFIVGDTTNNKGYWIPLMRGNANSSNNVQIKDELTGTVYTISIKIYDNRIAPGASSPCALTQVYMLPTATQESVAAAGETYDIHCLSLGVQADGFDDAQSAIETAFQFDVENLTDDQIKAIAAMFGANFTAGYYSNGGFTPIA